MTGPDGVGPRRPGRDRDVETLRSLRWLAVTVPAAILVGSSLFLIFGSHWWTRPYGYFGHAGPYHADSTVLVSTLVLVYTFFIAAYGVITPLLVGKGDCFKASQIKKGRVAFLRLSALVLMAGAVILDLVRLANSVGDLYTATMHYLSPPNIGDTAAEFERYLIVNAAVLVFALIMACWPERPADQPGGEERPA